MDGGELILLAVLGGVGYLVWDNYIRTKAKSNAITLKSPVYGQVLTLPDRDYLAGVTLAGA
jgi:hypothetical protein